MRNIYRYQLISFILSLPIFFIIQMGFNIYRIQRKLEVGLNFILFFSIISFLIMLILFIFILRGIKKSGFQIKNRLLFVISWLPYFLLLSYLVPRIAPYSYSDISPPITGLLAIFLLFLYEIFLIAVVNVLFEGHQEERI